MAVFCREKKRDFFALSLLRCFFALCSSARALGNGLFELGENGVDGRLLLGDSRRLDHVRGVVVVIGIHLDL